MDFLPAIHHNADMPKRSSKNPNEAHPATEPTDQAAPVPELTPEAQQESGGKNPAAVALGKLGGKKGGLARAKKLTAKRRSEIAKKAAAARWKKT